MNSEYRDLCSEVLKMAKESGSDQGDIILSRAKSLNLKAQKQKIDELKVSSSQVIGVRVIKDQKVGVCYSESFDTEALKTMVTTALDNATNMKANGHEGIFSEAGDHIIEAEEQGSELAEKIELTLQLEKTVLDKDPRARAVPYNGLSETESEYYYLNTNNTFHFENDFYYSGFTSALVEDKGVNSMHYHGGIGRKLSDLNVNDLANESLEHAIQWLTATPVKTGNYDIIFTADAFENLKGAFGIIFSAKAASEKINPFKDEMNTIVADPRLSIQDCPKYEKAFFKNTLDSEGFVQTDLKLIENGKLVNFYHNTKTAAELKMTANNRGTRSPRGGLGVSGTTQVWSSRDGSDHEVTRGEYLEIHSLQGLHSGANAISGDFSFGASGYVCRDGERIKPLKGITVSGNFYQMLKNIRLMSSTIYSTSDQGFFAPTIRFGEMSVAGE